MAMAASSALKTRIGGASWVCCLPAYTSVRHPRNVSLRLPACEVMLGCGPSFRPSTAWLLARASAAAMSRHCCPLPSRSSDHSFSTLACECEGGLENVVEQQKVGRSRQ